MKIIGPEFIVKTEIQPALHNPQSKFSHRWMALFFTEWMSPGCFLLEYSCLGLYVCVFLWNFNSLLSFLNCQNKSVKLFLSTLNSWVESAFGLEECQWSSLITCKLGMMIIFQELWDLSSSKLIKFSSQILTSRLADYLGIFQICSILFDCVPTEKLFQTFEVPMISIIVWSFYEREKHVFSKVLNIGSRR